MIDVPVEVKDALRDGRQLKNYRLVVLASNYYATQLNNYEAVYAPQSGLYRFYYPAGGFAYGIMIGIDGGGYWDADPTETEIKREFYVEEGARILAFTSSLENGEPFMQMEVGAEEFTIDNDNLVSESVSIDERMVSGDVLKFGLCEGSSLEFQYFGYPNITGRQLQTFIDVEYGENEPYSIPMGFFTVDKCSRQASTGIIKVTAYNKLQSDYLDAKANDLVDSIIAQGEDGSDEVSLYTILNGVLSDYAIEEYTETSRTASPSGWYYDTYTTPRVDSGGTSLGGYWAIYSIRRYVDINRDDYYKVTSDLREIKEKIYGLINLQRYRYTGQGGSAASLYYIAVNHLSANITYALDGYLRFSGDTNNRIVIYDSADYINTAFFTNKWTIAVSIPVAVEYSASSSGDATTEQWREWRQQYEQWMQETGFEIVITKKELSAMEKYRISSGEITTDVTLRELQSAVYETGCQFGQLSRETDLFSGVELNHSRLLPQETLYPDNALYPSGAQESAFKSQYSKLWADEGNVHKWKYLIITYKGLDEGGNEKDYTLQRTVNADGTDNYNCSDNWLFRNLVWTAEQIATYADAMVEKMRDVTWFPFEMWAAGLPYLETGDEIEIPLGEESYTSYVLQRQLKGIQNLQDTYINGTLDIF